MREAWRFKKSWEKGKMWKKKSSADWPETVWEWASRVRCTAQMNKWQPKDRISKQTKRQPFYRVVPISVRLISIQAHLSPPVPTDGIGQVFAVFCARVCVCLCRCPLRCVSMLQFPSPINIMPTEWKSFREYFSCIRFCCGSFSFSLSLSLLSSSFLFLFEMAHEHTWRAFSFDMYSYLFDEDNERSERIKEQTRRRRRQKSHTHTHTHIVDDAKQ